jgi:hypothetical protein
MVELLVEELVADSQRPLLPAPAGSEQQRSLPNVEAEAGPPEEAVDTG